MKIKQYCSVCREELEMEVVPTEEEEEDGVIWLRCPGCRGFLPRISGTLAEEVAAREATAGEAPAGERDGAERAGTAGGGGDATDVAPPPPAAGDEADEGGPPDAAGPADGADSGSDDEAGPRKAAEPPAGDPLDEYARRLAEADPATARPYRPWEAYEEGEVLHHLAWDDLGVVVGKEKLPGGRSALKVYFDQAGVVRLIEKADVEP